MRYASTATHRKRLRKEPKAAGYGWSALLGTIVGGAITLAATFMQGQMTRAKDVAAEQRKHLETIFELQLQVEDCIEPLSADGFKSSDDCKKRPDTRLQMLVSLYFPRLVKPTVNYMVVLTNQRIAMNKCGGRAVPPPAWAICRGEMISKFEMPRLEALAALRTATIKEVENWR